MALHMDMALLEECVRRIGKCRQREESEQPSDGRYVMRGMEPRCRLGKFIMRLTPIRLGKGTPIRRTSADWRDESRIRYRAGRKNFTDILLHTASYLTPSGNGGLYSCGRILRNNGESCFSNLEMVFIAVQDVRGIGEQLKDILPIACSTLSRSSSCRQLIAFSNILWY
jgi:hypothetical protein